MADAVFVIHRRVEQVVATGTRTATPYGGMSNPITTAGDIIVGGSAGVPDRLAIGAAGKVLGVVAGSPAWVDPTGGGEAGVSSFNTRTGPVNLTSADVYEALGYTPPNSADLADVALSGAYADLLGLPAIPAAPGDIGAATAAQGAKADTAVQPAALAGKVDVDGTKVLSDENYTSAEKNKLAGLSAPPPTPFKGVYLSLAALEAAHPAATAGDYADVDTGTSTDAARYLWDANDNKWVGGAAGAGSGLEIGDALTSARAAIAGFLPMDGAIKLQSAYPALFAEVGKIGGVPNTAIWDSANTSISSADVKSIGSDGAGVWVIFLSSGYAVRSTDDGLTWTDITTSVNLSGGTMFGIATDGTGVWIATGGSGKARKSVDNGVTWTVLSTGFGTNAIYDIGYYDGKWVAVGANRIIRISSNAGASWVSASSFGAWATARTVYSVVVKGGVWLAAALSGGSIHKSTDGGVNWASTDSNSLDAALVTITDSGVYIALKLDASMVRSVDGGASWAAVAHGTGLASASAIFSFGSVVIVVSDSGDGMRSLDDGVTWAAIVEPNEGSNYSVHCAGGVWLIGASSGQVSRSAVSFPYSPATEFKIPTQAAAEGMTAFIKAL